MVGDAISIMEEQKMSEIFIFAPIVLSIIALVISTFQIGYTIGKNKRTK